MEESVFKLLGVGREVLPYRLCQVGRIDTDFDKDVERFDGSLVNGYEAAVSVVYEHIAAESSGSEIVDAASAVSDITEDYNLSASESVGSVSVAFDATNKPQTSRGDQRWYKRTSVNLLEIVGQQQLRSLCVSSE